MVVPAAAVAPAVAVAAPVVSSQYHAQDDLGQYNYGYSNPNSAKVEWAAETDLKPKLRKPK